LRSRAPSAAPNERHPPTCTRGRRRLAGLAALSYGVGESMAAGCCAQRYWSRVNQLSAIFPRAREARRRPTEVHRPQLPFSRLRLGRTLAREAIARLAGWCSYPLARRRRDDMHTLAQQRDPLAASISLFERRAE